MRKVSFYMEYIARTMPVREAVHTPKRAPRQNSSYDGIPDPWDVEKNAQDSLRMDTPAAGQKGKNAYKLESFYDDALVREYDSDKAEAYSGTHNVAYAPSPQEVAPEDAYDDGLDPNAWDFGAGQWRDFLATDTGKQSPITKPEGMRLDAIGTDDNILTEDELRRAMAFLNDDAFLVTGIGVSESARRSIEATSKIQPLTPDMLAFDIAERKQSGQEEPFEIIDVEMRARGSQISAQKIDLPRSESQMRNDNVGFYDEPEGHLPQNSTQDREWTSRREETGRRAGTRSGAKTAFWIFLILFILSLGTVAYLWFFTDLLSFQNPAASVYEIRLDGERVGHVIDGQAVLDAIEADRREVQARSGLEAEPALPVTMHPAVVEERFIAPEQDMIDYIRKRADILVKAAGVYLDGRLIGAVSGGQVLQRAMNEALAPFQSLLDKRELTDIGFVEQLESRDMLVSPDEIMEAEELSAKLLGVSGQTNSVIYEVEAGDSLSSIARRNDIPISQLRYANPELIGQDLIKPGMQLRIEQPNRLLTVEFTERVRVETSIPYETVTKTSSKLYTTQKETEQKGVSGLREALVDRRYVAGVLVEETVLEETVIREPVNEIVVKGTKKASSSSSSSSKYITPVKGRISSRFGARNGSTHYGLDYAASTGTPIYAARAGTVTFSGTNSTYGKLVKIDHGDGVETRYAHCSALKVKKGDKVKQGDIIALVGSTGRSTGPHLHFEIRINGSAKDPEKYVK